MTKLFYVANVRLPTEKAHGIQIMEMCQAFAETGREVELVVPQRETIVNDRVVSEDPYHYFGVKENFEIKRLWCLDWVKWGKIGFLIQSLIFAIRATFYSLGKEGFFYTRDEMIAVLLKLCGKKVFWEAHMGHKNIFSSLAAKLRIPIIAITEGLKKAYLKMGVKEEEIRVAPDGVNLEKFSIHESKEEARAKLGLASGRKLVLYSGHLYEWKGVETLAAAASLSSEDYDFLFLGGSDKHIEAFQKRHADEKNIKVLGRKPYSEVPLFLKAADLLVLPNSAKEEISRLFTSPMKLFEYMASGTPIVVSNLPSLKEILTEDEAFFFQPDDASNLSEVIQTALANKEKAEEKAQKAYAKVEKYSWLKRAQKITDFMTEKAI